MSDDDDDFYAAPESKPGPKPPPRPGESPGAWPWFIAYCVLMGLVYLFVIGLGVLYLVIPEEAIEQDEEMDPIVMRIMGVVFIVIGLGLLAVFAGAPFLPRRQWAWIYDLVLICLGLSNCCTWPLTIPLLIYWIKPQTRQWFGMG